jgi:hypothetical protein
MGEWRYSSTFLDIGTSWKCVAASRPCRFIPGEGSAGTHSIGDRVGPRAGLDAVEKRKILHCRESNRLNKISNGDIMMDI